jgi:hypothetical protein
MKETFKNLVVGAGIGFAVAAIVFLALSWLRPDVVTLQLSSNSEPTSIDLYLAECSGLDINSEITKTVAISNCMGRINGLVAGHYMTVEYAKLANTPVPKRFWCIPDGVASGQLLIDVLEWVKDHDTTVKKLKFDPATSNVSSLVIASQALTEKYGCAQ